MLVKNSTCTWLSASAAVRQLTSQIRIGLLPLAELDGPLLLGRAELVDQFFQQFVLPILGRQNAAQQPGMFLGGLLAVAWSIHLAAGRDVDLREERLRGLRRDSSERLRTGRDLTP